MPTKMLVINYLCFLKTTPRSSGIPLDYNPLIEHK